MKRCPECYEGYGDSEKFCELDGQRLLPDPALLIAENEETAANFSRASTATDRIGQAPQANEAWLIGTAGVVLGVVVCVGGYLAYSIWSDNSGFKEPSAPAFASQTRQPTQPSRPLAPRAETTDPVDEEVTSEPEASPEPAATPVEESKAVAAKINQGPVSTGQRRDKDDDSAVQTVIQMNDGTNVEVDAAWEDGQGVWYRRGGMVVFVERQRVKAMTGRAAQKAASASTQ